MQKVSLCDPGKTEIQRFGSARVLKKSCWTGARGINRHPFSLCSSTGVRTHFKHSVELVDGEGEIADVLAAVEDFLLARATYEAARQRWPKERIRLRQETRIVEDGR